MNKQRRRREFVVIPNRDTHPDEQLIRAASKGNVVQLQAILNSGGNPNLPGKDSLLYLAIRSRCPKCTDALVKAGAKVTNKELSLAREVRLQATLKTPQLDHSPPIAKSA